MDTIAIQQLATRMAETAAPSAQYNAPTFEAARAFVRKLLTHGYTCSEQPSHHIAIYATRGLERGSDTIAGALLELVSDEASKHETETKSLVCRIRRSALEEAALRLQKCADALLRNAEENTR